MTSNHYIVHLGIGNFHRAHQAVYTQMTNEHWEIYGVSLRRPTVRDQLKPHQYRYDVIEKSVHHEHKQCIDIIKNILVALESPSAVLTKMTAPACKLISLTITEKGYCIDPATGSLQLTHSDIQHDLKNLASPKSAIGFIVAALKQRKSAGIPAFTIMSCDNISHNGNVLKKACLAFANQLDRELASWINSEVAFPSTMVDRIVPAPSEKDIASAKLICEPFKQWVIEDSFCNDRPRWELAGAQVVTDVLPFETMKLRLLNASHSALAYMGFLSGYECIYQAVNDPQLKDFVYDMMTNEIIPNLNMPVDIDLHAYRDEIIERFSNPTLPHTTYQVAMDGSQKLSQRILPSIIACIANNQSYNALLTVIAYWIRYTNARNSDNKHFTVQDPMANIFSDLHQQSKGNIEQLISSFLSLDNIFPAALNTAEIINHLSDIYRTQLISSCCL